jgi:tRNA nucleotidyltransferase/poly(A) polymerase
LLDPLHGLFDLEEGLLRIADAATFGDDPLRVLRAVQLVGRFGLRAEEQTLQILREMVQTEEFRTLSLERVTDEWKKLFLKATQPSRGLQFAHDLGLTDFPVVLATDTCANLAEREQLSPDQRLVAMLSVLFEHKKEETRTEILERYLFGSEIENQIGHVLQGLDRLLSVQPTANNLRQFLRDLLPVPLTTFFVAAIASGKLRPIRAQSWLTLIEENNLDEAARSTLLRGQDLIELGLPMGPRIGEWIAYIEHLRDEGTLETREQALHTVTELLTVCPSPPQIMPAKNTRVN